ncbi:MAG TPA: hypothetical protein VL359_02050, partial [bacterium]|nr:hypothetical protein [bacterium]
EVRRAGNIVAAADPGKVMTICLHQPWPDASSRTGFGYPVGGAIDAMIDQLPDDKKEGGWDTAGTPLGALSLKGTAYATVQASTLADLFDGYIVQGALRDYTTVTPIPDFITPAEADRAAANYPGVKPAPLTGAQVQAAIGQDVDALQKALSQLR